MNNPDDALKALSLKVFTKDLEDDMSKFLTELALQFEVHLLKK